MITTNPDSCDFESTPVTRRFGKSLATNVIAAAIVGIALALPAGFARDALLSVGLFALSGALTNWIAIHMLFERVPGFYGSGIIPNRFEEFKSGIRTLIMDNFFTEENFARLTETATHRIDLSAMGDKIDYGELFDGLVEGIQKSPLGGMLSMVGGAAMLEKFREPVEKEMRKRVQRLLGTDAFHDALADSIGHAGIRDQVATLVDRRLDELTPQHVKDIVQRMIREHLGWLVVWGGVFGGLIGFVSALLLSL